MMDAPEKLDDFQENENATVWPKGMNENEDAPVTSDTEDIDHNAEKSLKSGEDYIENVGGPLIPDKEVDCDNAEKSVKFVEDYIENVDDLSAFDTKDICHNANTLVPVKDCNEHVDKDVSGEDINENEFAHVSLNVIESELDTLICLNEYSTDEEKLDNEMEVEAIQQNTESMQLNTKMGQRKAQSPLHCAICNNYFENPKLLLCLHTFCQLCLMKGAQSHHKYIFCQICRRRCKIPPGGIDKLTDNVVVASLIEGLPEKEQYCVICKLHNEVNICTGMCVDCGDAMCKDCCQKHTFSRLTAKHVVITLDQMESGQYTKPLQKEELISCKQHFDEPAEYFCTVCREPICKNCAQSEHRSHKIGPLKEAISGKKKLLKEKFDLFKRECDSKLVDDTDESYSLISEHKKKEFEKLKDGKDALIAIIEEKYLKCAENLQNEYKIKERKYCDHKKMRLEYLSSDVENLTESIQFFLNEGNDVQAAMLESTITASLEDKRLKMKNICPKLTRKSFFPEVRLFKEHAQVLDGLTFFSTYHIYKEQKRADQEKKIAQSEMHVENGEIRMKLGGNFSTETNNENTRSRHKFQSQYTVLGKRMQKTDSYETVMKSASCVKDDRELPSLLSMDMSCMKPSIGRGTMLMTSPPRDRGSNLELRSPIGRGSMLKTGPENKSSLLGEYTGQNRQSLLDVISNISTQSNFNSNNSGNRPKLNKPNLMGNTFILDLKTSLDTSIIMDKKAPSNVDVVFMSPQNFALADIRNHRIKIFNISGKLIKYIDDPSPMSVTYCANHLLWSSQFSFVKLFDMQSQEIVRVQRVPQIATHPLTSFMNVKYLIGNMDQYKVDACTIDGLVAHCIQPRDKFGVPLRDILHIAARSSNQLVCVDRQLRKLVVNDFDGNCIGEFSQDGFEPGGVCITEHDNIFVTDRNRNKLLLLSPKADFIHEWNTVIDSPACVSSNSNGLLIVAGNTRSASIYQYSTL